MFQFSTDSLPSSAGPNPKNNNNNWKSNMPMHTRDAVSAVAVCFFRGQTCRFAFGLLGISVLADTAQAQGFLEDSHGTLTLRNYYMDRDYKDDGAKTATREWAQGFIMNAESGFTEGPVGFGLDARALVGMKLDSSPDRSGTELLPVSASDGRAADEYSRLALTGKLKFSETTIKTGDVSIFLPFAFASPSRLL
ncbi:OprD family outer membrane protein, partial [Pseudomonas coronafaciens pv. garcae]